MWTLLKSLLLKWGALRVLWNAFGSLAFLLPIAFLLKMFGLPILMALAVLALPVFLVLAVIGLPIILVLVVGGGLLAVVFAALTFGMVVLKLLLPFILLYWVVKLMWRWVFGRGGDRSGPISSEPKPDTGS
jgi:hypothetical protein